MNYSIDFKKIFVQFVAPSKRFERNLSWIKSLVSPLNTVHNEFFNVFLKEQRYIVKRNGQTLILENTLNNAFNPDFIPPIYIDNTGDDIEGIIFYNSFETYPPVIFYNESENIPVYWYNYAETFQNSDFKVFVPNGVLLNYTVDRIKFEINKFKPAGKKYTIINY